MWELTNEEFTGLMQQYQKLIYTVCLQFVHEPHTAEDLTPGYLPLRVFGYRPVRAAVLQTVARPRGGQQMQGPPEKRLGAQGGCPGDDALPEPRGAPGSDADDPAQ